MLVTLLTRDSIISVFLCILQNILRTALSYKTSGDFFCIFSKEPEKHLHRYRTRGCNSPVCYSANKWLFQLYFLDMIFLFIYSNIVTGTSESRLLQYTLMIQSVPRLSMLIMGSVYLEVPYKSIQFAANCLTMHHFYYYD